jgi:hypothetical protein
MTTGALLYAFDGDICYTAFAIECAKRIKKYLDIPVSLVTDSMPHSNVFDQVILLDKQFSKNRRWWADIEDTTSWLNHSRSRAQELSPYDRTLLLDVDYVVQSDLLGSLLESSQEFFAHKSARSIQLPDTRYQTFGTKNTDMWWATVVVFDRSKFSRDVFEIWQMVESNYRYYADFFGFNAKQFRNDYALSIALLVANGGVVPACCEIPWPLMNVDPEIAIEKCQDHIKTFYSTTDRTQKKYHRLELSNQDLHIMGKSYLEQVYAL